MPEVPTVLEEIDEAALELIKFWQRNPNHQSWILGRAKEIMGELGPGEMIETYEDYWVIRNRLRGLK